MTIRVLQCGMTDNLGGIESFLMNYYRNIDKTKIQFDFINIYNNELCFSDEIVSLGGKIYNVPSYYTSPIKYIKTVKAIINKESYSIIHCHMNSAVMLFPLIAAKLSNAKVIISHSHNASSDKGVLKSVLHNFGKKFIPLFANRFFACSDKAGNWFFSKSILNSSKYKVIYNAVDTSKYKFNEEYRQYIRDELNISKEKVVIGHVGRFNKQKNHHFLINMFNELKNDNNNLMLLLVGQGPLLHEMKEMVDNLGISQSVLFLGLRSDIHKIFNAMDLFVLPSLYEGLPLVGVEAQINGLTSLFSSSITQELRLLKKSKFLDLDPELWVNEIENCLGQLNREKIVKPEFDISEASQYLQSVYFELFRSLN